MGLVADLGVRIGVLPTGETNSVIDVPGVGLGHSTVVYDDVPPPFGRGVARTGVTVIDFGGDAWSHPVIAGVSVLNGAGELTARSQVDEWGLLETPVFLTSTMQVGRVYDAACRLLMAEQIRIGVDDVIIPAVGECDDSWLNDPRHMHVTDEHVAAALAAARVSAGATTPPDQGAVGAGTGMSVFDHKGGIGTSSRLLSDGHVVGVVLLTNFGSWERLRIDGVAVGRALGRPAHVEPPPAGSCLGIVVTDAPIDHSGCERLARRVGLGLARTGSVATHGSGEIFLAAALGLRAPRDSAPSGVPLTGRDLNEYFEAVVDASEEAVLASMLAAHDVTGREGRTIPALPVEAVRRILAEGRHL